VNVKVDEGSFGHGESRITPARDGALGRRLGEEDTGPPSDQVTRAFP
jgi:hypothetical protein